MANQTAALQQSCVGDWANKDTRPLLPHERMQLRLHGTLAESHIPKQILKYSTGHAVEHYIQDKLRISKNDLKIIDWDTLEKSQKLLS